ncbi:TIGR03960 family B12-binding radical SAM protein [Desulfovulcanus sp.]
MKELLPFFIRPSHYLGNEINSVHKDKREVLVHIALAFPDLYEVGMAYMGQRILYEVVNARAEFWAERVFAPSKEVAKVLQSRNIPLATLESDTPLKELDCLCFSLTHELAYTNVLYMLDLAGIPLRASQREQDFPLVIAGGGGTFNAEPLAPFLDLMVIGDGEEILIQILEVIKEGKAGSLSKGEILDQLRSYPGVYIPAYFDVSPENPHILLPVHSDYTRVEKNIVTDLNRVSFPTKQIIPFGKVVHDRFVVEIARGCTRGCRFCQAGMIYRPVRERDVENIARLIDQGLDQTGFEDLSFLSLSTGDFSALEHLFVKSYAKCAHEQVAISLPSLRAGSVSENMMQLMARIRRTGATLAPEAGTQRLRDIINKGITEAELLEHTQKLFDLGWSSIKLYFMIGLPTETEEDLEGILDLCLKVLATAKTKKRIKITASISPFVPKSHTPFQWEKQIGFEELNNRLKFLKRIFRLFDKLNLKWHKPEMSILEGVFSRGGRELADSLEEAYKRGAIFTSWADHVNYPLWQEVFEEKGIDIQKYLGPREYDQPLPWDHILSGVEKRYLLKELNRAMQGKITRDCRYYPCRACGVCNFDKHKSSLSVQAAKKEIKPILNLRKSDKGQKSDFSPANKENLGLKEAHIRLWYEKLGLSVYLSQLEVQKVLERAMRRAKWPLSFSSGFHPLPLLSFGRALPVGVGSKAEWVNVYLRKTIDKDSLLQSLNVMLPEGMRAFHVEELSLAKKQAQALWEDFEITFLGPSDWIKNLQEKWNEFVNLKEYIKEKMGKKKSKEIDVRALVESGNFEQDVLKVRFSWQEMYLNPLFIVGCIFPDLDLNQFQMIKTRQLFS